MCEQKLLPAIRKWSVSVYVPCVHECLIFFFMASPHPRTFFQLIFRGSWGERNIDVRETHPLVASRVCPSQGQESNLCDPLVL